MATPSPRPTLHSMTGPLSNKGGLIGAHNDQFKRVIESLCFYEQSRRIQRIIGIYIKMYRLHSRSTLKRETS